MLKFMFGVPEFRRRLLDEVVDVKEENGGGEGGGGGTGTDEAAKAAKEAEAAQREQDKQELDRLRGENVRLAKFREVAGSHVDYNEETGAVILKNISTPKAPTTEELDRIQLSSEVADNAVRVMDMNRQAEQVIINKYKAQDPLFAKSFQKAREKVNGVPPAQRTEKLWDRAMALARGEMQEEYNKYNQEIGEKRAMEKLTRGGSAALPQGGGTGGGGNDTNQKFDPTKVTLTREQYRAAEKMVDAGLLLSIDDYKKSAVELGIAEVSQ